jgi:hypothetical protein
MLSGTSTIPSNAGRLDSWKEIAVFLRCGVRTVQRWEKTEGLPVHRHVHMKRGTIYALCSELEAWLRRRDGSRKSMSTPLHPFDRLRSLTSQQLALAADLQSLLQQNADMRTQILERRSRERFVVAATAQQSMSRLDGAS